MYLIAIVKWTASSLLPSYKGIAETSVLFFFLEFWHWYWNKSNNLTTIWTIGLSVLYALSRCPWLSDSFFSYHNNTFNLCRTYTVLSCCVMLPSGSIQSSTSCPSPSAQTSHFSVNPWWIFQSGCCWDWINEELFFTVESFSRVLFWNGSSTN